LVCLCDVVLSIEFVMKVGSVGWKW